MPRQKNAKLASERNLRSGNNTEETSIEDLHAGKKNKKFLIKNLSPPFSVIKRCNKGPVSRYKHRGEAELRTTCDTTQS